MSTVALFFVSWCFVVCYQSSSPKALRCLESACLGVGEKQCLDLRGQA
jgi:hypothetical protein